MKILFIAALFLFVCGSAYASAVFRGEYAPDLGVFEPSSDIGELCLNGAWQFTAAELDRFFSEPYVKEGLRIKRSSLVFDFMADGRKTSERTCVILDIPASVTKGNAISALICDRIAEVKDINFNFGWDRGTARVILTGAAESVAHIMKAYYASEFSD